MDQFNLSIGGKSWTIASPLRFKQLRLIEPAMSKIIAMKVSGEGTTEKFYDEMANVILAAVMPIDQTFTRAALDDLPVSIGDLTEAVKTIAQAAGMWKAPTSGEAQPPQTAATDQPNL